jgi:hypothetical protein
MLGISFFHKKQLSLGFQTSRKSKWNPTIDIELSVFGISNLLKMLGISFFHKKQLSIGFQISRKSKWNPTIDIELHWKKFPENDKPSNTEFFVTYEKPIILGLIQLINAKRVYQERINPWVYQFATSNKPFLGFSRKKGLSRGRARWSTNFSVINPFWGFIILRKFLSVYPYDENRRFNHDLWNVLKSGWVQADCA